MDPPAVSCRIRPIFVSLLSLNPSSLTLSLIQNDIFQNPIQFLAPFPSFLFLLYFQLFQRRFFYFLESYMKPISHCLELSSIRKNFFFSIFSLGFLDKITLIFYTKYILSLILLHSHYLYDFCFRCKSLVPC